MRDISDTRQNGCDACHFPSANAAMSFTLSTLFPVFGSILAGFICRRVNVLGSTAASELNRFMVWLGLPALLFRTGARTAWEAL